MYQKENETKQEIKLLLRVMLKRKMKIRLKYPKIQSRNIRWNQYKSLNI